MYNTNLKNIGRNIKAERVRKGYSQEQLAELANTTRHTISMIETATQHPKLLSIINIVNALNIDINKILQ